MVHLDGLRHVLELHVATFEHVHHPKHSPSSHLLAPPGHSYHALGDFDVGKKGFGHKNFSDEFSATEEYKRLSDLGYIDIRYPQNNPFGVRYEPWHIKVV